MFYTWLCCNNDTIANKYFFSKQVIIHGRGIVSPILNSDCSRCGMVRLNRLIVNDIKHGIQRSWHCPNTDLVKLSRKGVSTDT